MKSDFGKIVKICIMRNNFIYDYKIERQTETVFIFKFLKIKTEFSIGTTIS